MYEQTILVLNHSFHRYVSLQVHGRPNKELFHTALLPLQQKMICSHEQGTSGAPLGYTWHYSMENYGSTTHTMLHKILHLIINSLNCRWAKHETSHRLCTESLLKSRFSILSCYSEETSSDGNPQAAPRCSRVLQISHPVDLVHSSANKQAESWFCRFKSLSNAYGLLKILFYWKLNMSAQSSL